MSFGPLINVKTEHDQTNSKRNSNAVRLEYQGLSKEKKDEEGNLSLVSFEGTEQENEKYYSEEELSNIIGITEDISSIKVKNIDKTKSKGTFSIIKPEIGTSEEQKLHKDSNIFKQIPFNQENSSNSNPSSPNKINTDENFEDPYDFLIDPEILAYIETLRDKFMLDEDLDPKEFIFKIDQEIETGNLTDKQHYALIELKKGLLTEMLEPLQIEGDIDSEEDDESYYLSNKIQSRKISPRFQNEILDLQEGNFEEKEEFLNRKINDPSSQKIKNSKQTEIIDHTKTEYYFNAQNKDGLNRIHSLESEQDSKGSTNKTPWFIETPTNGSQINSLNNTGQFNPEDLSNALNKPGFELRHTIISSGNSSWEHLGQPVQGIDRVLSFGGDGEILNEENIIENRKNIVVSDYTNQEAPIEFDTFRT